MATLALEAALRNRPSKCSLSSPLKYSIALRMTGGRAWPACLTLTNRGTPNTLLSARKQYHCISNPPKCGDFKPPASKQLTTLSEGEYSHFISPLFCFFPLSSLDLQKEGNSLESTDHTFGSDHRSQLTDIHIGLRLVAVQLHLRCEFDQRKFLENGDLAHGEFFYGDMTAEGQTKGLVQPSPMRIGLQGSL